MTTEQLKVLEALVEELIKDQPEEKIVRERMSAAGIEYSRDPIDRINKVLMALHFEQSDKEFK